MNKKQKKHLRDLREQLNIIKFDVESIKQDEEEKLINLPEALQYSSKGEELEEWAEQLDDLTSALDDACGEFDNLELE